MNTNIVALRTSWYHKIQDHFVWKLDILSFPKTVERIT